MNWPDSVTAADITKTWASHMTFGNILGMVGIGIPLTLGAWRSRIVYSNFRAKYFPNVLHVQLHTIIRSPHSQNLAIPKYRVYARTIFERILSDVIHNEHGIKVLQKYSRRCTFENPLIQIEPPEDHYYICNAILIKLNEIFNHYWFARDINIDSINNYPQYDILETKTYVFALLSTLNTHSPRENSIWSRRLFYLRKIRGFVIQEKFIQEILELFDGSEGSFGCIHELSDEEWMSYLEHDDIFDYESIEARWKIIKEIVKKYDTSKTQLCLMEIPNVMTENNRDKTLFNPPIHNAPAWRESTRDSERFLKDSIY